MRRQFTAVGKAGKAAEFSVSWGNHIPEVLLGVETSEVRSPELPPGSPGLLGGSSRPPPQGRPPPSCALGPSSLHLPPPVAGTSPSTPDLSPQPADQAKASPASTQHQEGASRFSVLSPSPRWLTLGSTDVCDTSQILALSLSVYPPRWQRPGPSPALTSSPFSCSTAATASASRCTRCPCSQGSHFLTTGARAPSVSVSFPQARAPLRNLTIPLPHGGAHT